MKKAVMLMLGLGLSVGLWAQSDSQPAPRHEVGFTFYRSDFSPFDIGDFGILYTVGDANARWRFQINDLLIRNSDQVDILGSSATMERYFRGQALVGREWRQPVSDRFSVRYGLDVGYGLSRTHRVEPADSLSTQESTNTYHRILGNLVLGANYHLTPHFSLGVEFLPGMRYITGSNQYVDGSGETTIERTYNALQLTEVMSLRFSLLYRW